MARKKKNIPEEAPTEQLPMQCQPERPLMISIADVSNVGSRQNQQDCFGKSDLQNQALLQEKGILAVVADGMGGLSNGAESSRIVVEMLLTYFRTVPFEAQPPLELMRMVRQANRNVLENNAKNGGQMSGSTVVAVNIKEDKLYFVSVGDSHIYLLRNGKLLLLNREHNYASDLDDQAASGQITVREAYTDPQRKSLTSYIGIEDLTLIDYNSIPIELTRGDQILLMSDGVYGALSDAEITAAVLNVDPRMQGANLENAVLAKQKPGQDNFTCMIINMI